MRILITGATGAIGSDAIRRLNAEPGRRDIVGSVRRPTDAALSRWNIGHAPIPPELTGHWDVIVHAADSMRWTMTHAEAHTANIVPLRSVLRLADKDTHFVHLSTAYVGEIPPDDRRGASFGKHRNGYEWSKAVCEDLVTNAHSGPATIIRPPLVMGRRSDGGIARFSSPYALLEVLATGLAAVIVGDPQGYAEISSVDEVTDAIVAAVTNTPPSTPRIEVISAGLACLTLEALLEIACTTLNEHRAGHGVPPLTRPPIVSVSRWNRFYLPLAERRLPPIQRQTVQLLSTFESYISMTAPFEPSRVVNEPGQVLAASTRHWAARKPRLALGQHTPWTVLAA